MQSSKVDVSDIGLILLVNHPGIESIQWWGQGLFFGFLFFLDVKIENMTHGIDDLRKSKKKFPTRFEDRKFFSELFSEFFFPSC